MQIELTILLGISTYGALQGLLTSASESVQQVHRNFSESSYIFAASILGLLTINGFGPWSQKGAIVYAVGRSLYALLTIKPFRSYRKWAWATSIAGIIGCLAELIRATQNF